MRFSTALPTITLSTINRSLIRLTSITLSTHFSATTTLTPAVPSLHPVQKILFLPNSLALPPFHRVSCKQQKSKHLLSHISATSPLRPVSDPTFTDPTLNLNCGAPIANFSPPPRGRDEGVDLVSHTRRRP